MIKRQSQILTLIGEETKKEVEGSTTDLEPRLAACAGILFIQTSLPTTLSKTSTREAGLAPKWPFGCLPITLKRGPLPASPNIKFTSCLLCLPLSLPLICHLLINNEGQLTLHHNGPRTWPTHSQVQGRTATRREKVGERRRRRGIQCRIQLAIGRRRKKRDRRCGIVRELVPFWAQIIGW